MFAEVVHGLLTNVLRTSGSDQPSLDTILPQPKWRIGIIPTGIRLDLLNQELILCCYSSCLCCSHSCRGNLFKKSCVMCFCVIGFFVLCVIIS